jgi:hypothetical protein
VAPEQEQQKRERYHRGERGKVALAGAGALITPALFSQPSARPDGEKREWLV